MTENSSSCLCKKIYNICRQKNVQNALVTVFGLVWTKTRHQKVQLRPIFWHFYRQIVGLTVLKQHLFRELCANEPVRAKRLRRSYGKKSTSPMFYDRSLTSSAWFKKKAHRTEKRRKQTHEQAEHTAEGLTLKIELLLSGKTITAWNWSDGQLGELLLLLYLLFLSVT